MSEIGTIVSEAATLRRAGSPFLLATVVAVRGSSYRRPGARMIVADDRWVAGCVSGGCLEGDVLRRGGHRTRNGEAVVVTYDSTSDDEIGWGYGLGCNGVVEVMLERIDTQTVLDPLLFAGECIEREERGVLVTVFRSEQKDIRVGARLSLDEKGSPTTSLPAGPARDALEKAARSVLASASRRRAESITCEAEGVTALVELIEPPPRLIVCGTGHDALPVVNLARSMGWRVTVAAEHPSAATRERFTAANEILAGDARVLCEAVSQSARSYAVIMSHGYDRDRDCLAALLGSRASFIGVLGPRRRAERMLAELSHGGLALTEAMLGRIHAPVGLDVGAETPQEIALSIISEVQAEITGAEPGRLRERVGPIHVPHPHMPGRGRGRGPVVAVVLAAGGSSRLGRPKQLEIFRGRPLLRHVVDEVRASACDEVAVVLGANVARIEPALEGAGVSVLRNDAWAEGLASSIREAVAWATSRGASALVTILADQPLLDRAHVDRLIDVWRAGAPAAASVYGGALGVPALFGASLFEELAALEGDRGAARVLRGRTDVAKIPWPEGEVDVDTEEQAEELRALPT
jgi:xanthine dehydrogenase accessory factor